MMMKPIQSPEAEWDANAQYEHEKLLKISENAKEVIKKA